MGARYLTATEIEERRREMLTRPPTPEQVAAMNALQAVFLDPILERLDRLLEQRGLKP